MKRLSRIEIIRKNVSIQRISMGGVLVACLVFSLAVNIKPANADKPDRAVHALFNLSHPETGPFPTDIFTITDHTQNTGRRVNLPYPDCTIRVSDCRIRSALSWPLTALSSFIPSPHSSLRFRSSSPLPEDLNFIR